MKYYKVARYEVRILQVVRYVVSIIQKDCYWQDEDSSDSTHRIFFAAIRFKQLFVNFQRRRRRDKHTDYVAFPLRRPTFGNA